MQLNVRPEPVRSRAPAKPKRPYYPPKPKTAEELAAEAAAEAAARKPAEQRVLPSGLWPFYHAHRWGVPLPPGPVPPDEGSDDELDETWRAREAERRIDGRRGVDPADAELMKVECARGGEREARERPRAPAACRAFARAHAAALSTCLRRPLLEHLLTLCDHQLLHRDDAHDCLLIADAVAGGAGGSGGGPSPKKRKKGGGSPAASSLRPTVPTATACSARGCSCGRRCATSAAGRSTRRVARCEAASEARRRGRCRRRRRDRQRNPSQKGLFVIAPISPTAAAASSGALPPPLRDDLTSAE